jgi:hypothetical protein
MKPLFVPYAAVIVAAVTAVAATALAQAPATAPAQAQAKAPDKAAAMKTSTVPQTPEWKQLLALVGSWEGTMTDSGQTMPATATVRMTGDGSAIMHVLGPDSPYEMVTMIHPDGKRLLATHYCAAHNQPRMAMVPSGAPNKVAFTFLDGTNIGPGEEHMKGVVFTFIDADHHDEAWTSSGSDKPGIFKFTRKKK